ncbi:hypothetical protein JYQ62_08115 [Nostoc sp. UHCC 0702]|nr:hypothetical protein JYQ62_08115 [Nostoc sp. UHCC 0702]
MGTGDWGLGTGDWGDEGDGGDGEMREMREMRERITNTQFPIPNSQCPIYGGVFASSQ